MARGRCPRDLGPIALTAVPRIAQLLLDFVENPPSGDDPVIRWRSPEDLLEAFAESVGLALREGEPAHSEAQLVRAAETVLRYSVHTSHPRFVNQNFAGPSPMAVVGDWMGAALNTTNATFEAAPVFTLMEQAVIGRMAAIAGYPAATIPPGLFTPGGSTATLYALQLARFSKEPTSISQGSTTPFAVFVSETGHYAARKSVALLGMGTDSLVKVAADSDGSIRPGALAEAVERTDRVPLAVIGTAGTTVTSAFDDLNALADVCEAHGMWLHVDGAWGGSALVSRRHRHRLAGIERSDSMLWNLHKMLGMTQQCSVLLVRDPSLLGPCFSAKADYLFQPDKLYAELDSGDRTFQCARRVDVLKAWLSWKASGDAGFEARIDHAVAMADHARARIAEAEDLAAVVAGDFSNVCFTWVPPELRPFTLDDAEGLHELQPRVKARMQREGTALIGYQPVHGLNCFRLIFNNPTVTTDDVDALIELVRRYSEEEWAAGMRGRVHESDP